MLRRLRQGDEVVVIAGNDRGKVGKVVKLEKQRVVVEGVNICKKHMKPTQENQKGQIIEIEKSVHISNVKPYADGKGVKLRAQFNEKGQKELYYLDGKKKVPFRSTKKSKK